MQANAPKDRGRQNSGHDGGKRLPKMSGVISNDGTLWLDKSQKMVNEREKAKFFLFFLFFTFLQQDSQDPLLWTLAWPSLIIVTPWPRDLIFGVSF